MSVADSPAAGRDAKGRFARGNEGGPGNPFARQTAQLRQAVLETMNEAEVRLITQRLLTLALQGDLQAIKLVLAYAIGKPQDAFDPDEVDRLEWELRKRLAVPAEEVEELSERVAARQANAVAQATAQAVALHNGQGIFQRLQRRGLLAGSLQPAAGSGRRPGVRPAGNGSGGGRR